MNEKKSGDLHQLVLIRGLAREARHWGDFIRDLEAAYQAQGIRTRIETIDLPGCGRHSEMTTPLSMERTADFMREKMKEILALEAEQGLPAADHRRLISISLGGMVAVSWMSRYPTDFHSAVLINSSFRGFSKVHERLRWNEWWRIPVILKEKDIEKREMNILDWISNSRERRGEALPLWVRIQESRPVSLLNLGIQLSAAGRFSPPSKLAVPLLVLSSLKDRMVSPACSAAIAKAYGGRLITHSTAGHDLTLDDGPWTASVIVEWKPEVGKKP